MTRPQLKGRPLEETGNRPEISGKRSSAKHTTTRARTPYRPAHYAAWRQRGRV